jgi:hypothetical protein
MFTVIFCIYCKYLPMYYHKCNVDNLVFRKHVEWKFIGKSGSDRLNFVVCVYLVPRSQRSKAFCLP